VVDPHTVRMHFTRPSPQMVFCLARESSGIVCRAAVNYWGKRFRQHPLATGAYALAEHLREQRIVMIANPLYRGRPDGDGDAVVPADQRMPFIKRLQLDYF